MAHRRHPRRISSWSQRWRKRGVPETHLLHHQVNHQNILIISEVKLMSGTGVESCFIPNLMLFRFKSTGAAGAAGGDDTAGTADFNLEEKKKFNVVMGNKFLSNRGWEWVGDFGPGQSEFVKVGMTMDALAHGTDYFFDKESVAKFVVSRSHNGTTLKITAILIPYLHRLQAILYLDFSASRTRCQCGRL